MPQNCHIKHILQDSIEKSWNLLLVSPAWPSPFGTTVQSAQASWPDGWVLFCRAPCRSAWFHLISHSPWNNSRCTTWPTITCDLCGWQWMQKGLHTQDLKRTRVGPSHTFKYWYSYGLCSWAWPLEWHTVHVPITYAFFLPPGNWHKYRVTDLILSSL
jgi:hypothetical protein